VSNLENQLEIKTSLKKVEAKVGIITQLTNRSKLLKINNKNRKNKLKIMTKIIFQLKW
jgi:hypothetical protein